MRARFVRLSWCVKNGSVWYPKACCGRSWLRGWFGQTRCGRAFQRDTSGESPCWYDCLHPLNPFIYTWGLTTTSSLSLSGVILHQTCWEPPLRLSCISYYEDACLCQFIRDVYCCFLRREKYLFKNRTTEVPPNSYYRSLYPKIIQDIEVGRVIIVSFSLVLLV